MTAQHKNLIVAIFGFFISVVSAWGQQEIPPQPRSTATYGAPGPPGLPIDHGLIILFIAALVFGIYKIMKLKKVQA